MANRADYPTSPDFRRRLDGPQNRESIAARPSRSAELAPAVVAHHERTRTEAEIIGAALLLAEDAARSIAALDIHLAARPDLFKGDVCSRAGMPLFAFMARARERLKVRT